MSESIKPKSIITRKKDLAQREFEGEMLVISHTNSQLHKFNSVGTFIWGVLKNPTQFADLCKAVEGEFDGFDPKTGNLELAQFMQLLEGKGLVAIER